MLIPRPQNVENTAATNTSAFRSVCVTTSNLRVFNMADIFSTSTSEPFLHKSGRLTKFMLFIIRALPLFLVILNT
ncbi:hypothetical protein EB796_019333 [Bugula neritina]|uniref:Uncharacterized protein n=1 Tax=Bugula neritina TaxID=10212 RepID=A0A7J7J8H9_BUGNE|nr:hypothetical protein EB796_019333 [Bugula neritina]